MPAEVKCVICGCPHKRAGMQTCGDPFCLSENLIRLKRKLEQMRRLRRKGDHETKVQNKDMADR